MFVVKTRPFIKVIMCRKQSWGAVTDGGGATHDVTGTAPTQRCQVMSYLASPSRWCSKQYIKTSCSASVPFLCSLYVRCQDLLNPPLSCTYTRCLPHPAVLPPTCIISTLKCFSFNLLTSFLAVLLNFLTKRPFGGCKDCVNPLHPT